jgi:hypothetical protein
MLETDTSRDMEFTSSGLIREIAEFTNAGIRTHPEWCESLAAAMVGMMAGKDRYIFNNLGKLPANIMVIYVGASALSKKTVPLKKVVRPLLSRLTGFVNEEILLENGLTPIEYQERINTCRTAASRTKGTTEWKEENAFLNRIASKMVDFLAPQKFTSEALISWLNNYPQGMIVGDEYTKMFKGATTKDYLTDNMEDLSRLYDCDIEKVATQSRGVEHPEDAFVSFVSATTYYILTVMSDKFFLQGTGTRVLWILDHELTTVDVEKEASTMDFFWGEAQLSSFEARMSELATRLMNIRYLPEGVIVPSFDASVALDKYRLNMENLAAELFSQDILNVDANLIGRLAQNAMKLALCHCIGRYAMEERGSVTEPMEISLEDANWGISKMERHLEYYRLMQEVASVIRETTTRSYKTDQDRVLYVVDRLSRRGDKVTVSELARQTGWLNRDCLVVLDTMVANDILETRQYEASNGRTVVFYVRKEIK